MILVGIKHVCCFSDSQGRLDAVDVGKAVEFVLSCMNFDGGFGCRPGSESHAGQVSFSLCEKCFKLASITYCL